MGLGPGAIGGAIAGAKGDPDKVTGAVNSQQGTSQLSIAPMSPEQAQLQQNSLQAYLQQQALAGQYQGNIGAAQGVQNQALGQMGNVLNGSAFQVSPQQQALIQQQAGYAMNQANQNTQQLLNQNLGQMSAMAGQQGIRGQAFNQLQGDAMRSAALANNQTTNAIQGNAMNQSLNLPFQQVAAQSPFIQQGSNMANNMMQQAQANQQAAQNPYLLNLMQNQRLQTGLQSTNGQSNGTQTAYGQPGSFLGAVQGYMGGMGQDIQLATGVAKATGGMSGGGSAPAGSSGGGGSSFGGGSGGAGATNSYGDGYGAGYNGNYGL